jgi:hypothetical protein
MQTQISTRIGVSHGCLKPGGRPGTRVVASSPLRLSEPFKVEGPTSSQAKGLWGLSRENADVAWGAVRGALDQLHQHLSQILALEQFEKGGRRILDAMLDGFLPRQLAFAYPP